jgi:hypothetical protein
VRLSRQLHRSAALRPAMVTVANLYAHIVITEVSQHFRGNFALLNERLIYPSTGKVNRSSIGRA